ncbi:MAG: cytochrome c [Bacteroidetes bacterium]|jgi:mono/diheme cytochrome c family protein|nr:cytochrome c [Bacteroidota bacterium]MBT5529588.1 cytochrome c [Cytophagia bacterium]MBT3423318.1 cytochrome c [Bacteroidota bacterium]MBT3802504.1 cytochrome c [Bacteroidota bacterium]MBT3935399.1 cytochrome c [Bacteroidota bacterium]
MKTQLGKSVLSILAVLMVGLVLVAFTPGQQKPWDVPAKYKSMKNPVKSDAASIATGKTMYSKFCKSCHGSKGKGDGPKAMNLDSKMRSFASAEYKKQTAGEKYYKSFIGRDEMPNFEKKIPDTEDRWAVINYMETMK